ncbi:hypothetical protein [Chryseobacterium sp. FH1]|uniref:hypothetical protein n=1 Tax=Chryseobacterium sp. FH1 TaxID=1233951 RepID=UPI00068DA936|nr:hypothetical protein [Chryseobacterium sp. FH1]
MTKNIQTIFYAFLTLIFLINCEKKNEKIAVKNYENYLVNTTWLINNEKLVGYEIVEKQFILKKKNDTALIWNFSAIEFTDKEKFTSYNSWECGNDCFTSIDGTYKFVDKSEIEFQIESITRTGTCEAPIERFGKPKIFTMTIEKFGDSLVLNKN